MAYNKFNCLIVLCIFMFTAKAQDTSMLKEQVKRLQEALISKDTQVLKQLLHNRVSFGHSNGWVQNFNDVFNDMKTGKLKYILINTSEAKITCTKKWAVCTSEGEFKGSVNDTEFSLKLHVMQTWIWVKTKWQLISRQSTKK